MIRSVTKVPQIAVFAFFVVVAQIAIAQSDGPSAWSRILIGSGGIGNQKDVTLLLATRLGKQARLESKISSAGGRVIVEVPEIGYLRVSIPAEKVAAITGDTSVAVFAIDGQLHLNDSVNSTPIPADSAKATQISTALAVERKQLAAAEENVAANDAQRTDFPASLLKPGSLYDPNAPMQATDWLARHSTYDGRGVTIAVVEGVADLSNPSLCDAKDLAGNTIPKIATILGPDYGTSNAPNWAGEVQFSANPKLKDGTTCPAASSSSEKIGVWHGVVGHTHGGLPEFCVAWNTESKTVRIDINHDGNFADEMTLQPYDQEPSYVKVSFGAQSASTYLQHDAKTGRVFLHTTPDNHTTMVATAAAGTDLMGTGLGGVAPGARLVFAQEGEGWSGLIEAFWTVANQPVVDLITASTGISSYPNDADPIYNLFLDRISDVTGKPILMAARNHGPVPEQSDAGHHTMTVGGYESADTLTALAVDEQHLPQPGAVIDYSSNGPSMSGGIGTDFITPVLGVTGWNWGNNEDRPGYIFVGKTYKLPHGYGLGGGTSVATPRAAGAVALLLSAAKQNNLKVDAAMIKQALMSSAKPIGSNGIYRQGAGLVQVEAAWEALQELSKQPKTAIHSSSTAISPLYPYWWRGPQRGDSIYLVRGVIAGEMKKLPLDLWMDDPTPDTSKYELSFVGDKNQFAIPASIDLSKRRTITVTFHSAKPGNYSGLIQLRRPGMRFAIAEVPVFVASTPDPAELTKGVEITKTVTAENQEFTVFNLPKHAQHVEAESTSHSRWIAASLRTKEPGFSAGP